METGIMMVADGGTTLATSLMAVSLNAMKI